MESILKNGLDQRPLPVAAPVVEHDNLRGAQYYQWGWTLSQTPGRLGENRSDRLG
jgi:hypothetical protein